MPGPQRILLADADELFRAELAGQLTREGYAVTSLAGAGGDIAGPFAFAILDEGMQDAAKTLKTAGVPVLFLTRGEGGADRIARPFRFSALLARRGALALGPAESSLRIGPYIFHPAAKLLEAEGRKVRLTEKEADILKFLHASAGAVSRDTLLHGVWGYGPAVATHTLETHIYRLRKKIEANPAKAEILLTEEGGYRLSAGIL
jgi:DNA-binding response OmpR family regulator